MPSFLSFCSGYANIVIVSSMYCAGCFVKILGLRRDMVFHVGEVCRIISAALYRLNNHNVTVINNMYDRPSIYFAPKKAANFFWDRS